MRPRVLLRPLVAIAVFAACAWLVRRQLAAVDAERVRQAIALVPARRLVMAALATAGSFGALAAMEHTLFAAIAAPVRWRRVLPTAFIAGTVSASVGLVLVSSALVRLRLYRRWQVPAGDVLRV